MKGYHTVIEIDAPADMVWEVLLDTESYPEWNPLVGEVGDDLVEQEEVRVYIKPLRQKLPVRILRLDEGRELRWQGALLLPQLVAGEHYYLLEPIAGGRCTLFKHGERFSGLLAPLIPGFLLRHMQNAFEEHNRLLKARVEQFWDGGEPGRDESDAPEQAEEEIERI